MTIIVDRNKPVKARLILEALASRPRIQIIKVLLRHGALSASEISGYIGISLSTVMEHLDILSSAGILVWTLERRVGKPIKKYRVADNNIDLKLDLRKYSVSPNLDDLKRYISEYIDKKTESSVLPLKPTIKDIMETLNIDLELATAVIDYYHLDEEYIIDKLEDHFAYLGDIEAISIKELAEQLRIHEYWALRLAQKLSEKKNYIWKSNMLFKID
jgi:DNA-binding transcriptional ArsR family regulator